MKAFNEKKTDNNPENSVVFVSDWAMENGKTYTVAIGKAYKGIRRKRKHVLGFVMDADTTVVVFRSEGRYYCESLADFCYQIRLARQNEKAKRDLRKKSQTLENFLNANK